jgi:hypothetical protein
MADPLRKDDELTTADLAGRTNAETERRPQLVRNEQRVEEERVTNRVDDEDINAETLASAADRDNRIERERENQTRFNRDVPAAGAANIRNVDQAAALFSETEVGDFRNRWSNIQTGFVDEPRRAVEEADNLVASLMKKLAEGFANERAGLEKQWDRGDNVSTEDLRVALQRYRSFFDRLLKV